MTKKYLSIENDATPDEVCQGIDMCKNKTCNLFPRKNTTKASLVPFLKVEIPNEGKLPNFVWPRDLVAGHEPAIDEGGDLFGSML